MADAPQTEATNVAALPPPPHRVLPAQSPGLWSYEKKKILAPMVRAGTLPLRVLSRVYGADMVYSEEIIDHAILQTERVVNERDGTIDFVPPVKLPKKLKARKRVQARAKFNQSRFRTYAGEPIVFQMGTNDAVRALRAARVVCRDVCAVDINMGCPKHFSVHAGMGAGLLSSPQTVKDILSTLVRNLDVPVTCKIRLLDTEMETLHLLRVIEGCGVAAIGVHARYVYDRPRHRALAEKIRPLTSSIGVPLLYNGDVFQHADFDEMCRATGCASAMAARGALWNCSVFRKEGFLPVYDVASAYLDLARRYNNPFNNTKYMVLQMAGPQVSKTAAYRQINSSKNSEQIRDALEKSRAEPSMADAKQYRLGVQFVSRQSDADTIDKNRTRHIRSLEQGRDLLRRRRLARAAREKDAKTPTTMGARCGEKRSGEDIGSDRKGCGRVDDGKGESSSAQGQRPSKLQRVGEAETQLQGHR